MDTRTGELDVNIVSFKGYSTNDADGLMLWNAVQLGLIDFRRSGLARNKPGTVSQFLFGRA